MCYKDNASLMHHITPRNLCFLPKKKFPDPA